MFEGRYLKSFIKIYTFAPGSTSLFREGSRVINNILLVFRLVLISVRQVYAVIVNKDDQISSFRESGKCFPAYRRMNQMQINVQN